MRVAHGELADVLDEDQPLRRRGAGQQRREQGRLARAGAARDEEGHPPVDEGRQDVAPPGGDGAEPDEVVEVEPPAAGTRSDTCAPPSASGGQDRVQPDPEGSSPSTYGAASSSRRPASPASRTASRRRASASPRSTGTRSSPSPRSTQTVPSPLTTTSVTPGCSRSSSRAPAPSSRERSPSPSRARRPAPAGRRGHRSACRWPRGPAHGPRGPGPTRPASATATSRRPAQVRRDGQQPQQQVSAAPARGPRPLPGGTPCSRSRARARSSGRTAATRSPRCSAHSTTSSSRVGSSTPRSTTWAVGPTGCSARCAVRAATPPTPGRTTSSSWSTRVSTRRGRAAAARAVEHEEARPPPRARRRPRRRRPRRGGGPRVVREDREHAAAQVGGRERAEHGGPVGGAAEPGQVRPPEPGLLLHAGDDVEPAAPRVEVDEADAPSGQPRADGERRGEHAGPGPAARRGHRDDEPRRSGAAVEGNGVARDGARVVGRHAPQRRGAGGRAGRRPPGLWILVARDDPCGRRRRPPGRAPTRPDAPRPTRTATGPRRSGGPSARWHRGVPPAGALDPEGAAPSCSCAVRRTRRRLGPVTTTAATAPPVLARTTTGGANPPHTVPPSRPTTPRRPRHGCGGTPEGLPPRPRRPAGDQACTSLVSLRRAGGGRSDVDWPRVGARGSRGGLLPTWCRDLSCTPSGREEPVLTTGSVRRTVRRPARRPRTPAPQDSGPPARRRRPASPRPPPRSRRRRTRRATGRPRRGARSRRPRARRRTPPPRPLVTVLGHRDPRGVEPARDDDEPLERRATSPLPRTKGRAVATSACARAASTATGPVHPPVSSAARPSRRPRTASARAPPPRRRARRTPPPPAAGGGPARPRSKSAVAATCSRASTCSGAVRHESREVLGLRGGPDGRADDGLDRVGVVGPRHASRARSRTSPSGGRRPVDRGAGPRPADAGLGGRLGDAPAQALVEAQRRAGVAGPLRGLGDAGQADEGVERPVARRVRSRVPP